jgi:hypothetical protein
MLGGVKTVVVGARPPELDALIERRKALGQDTRDEIWGGDDHMNPSPRTRHGILAVHLLLLVEPYATAAGLVGRLDW